MNPTTSAQSQAPTHRQLKVNLTLWRNAVRAHGGCSVEAYNAWQRFLAVRDGT